MSEYINKGGITENTPKNLMLGAGTLHKNLKYTPENGWNFAESIIGATSGGNKLTITPDILDVDLDGATVKVKGFTFKNGESAKLETNLVEITPELLKTTIIGELAEDSGIADYNMITTKSKIEEGDYFENLGYVGVKTDGKPIIIIMENALCTSGFEGEGKKGDKMVIKAVFECYQSTDKELDHLPIKIYYPKEV